MQDGVWEGLEDLQGHGGHRHHRGGGTPRARAHAMSLTRARPAKPPTRTAPATAS